MLHIDKTKIYKSIHGKFIDLHVLYHKNKYWPVHLFEYMLHENMYKKKNIYIYHSVTIMLQTKTWAKCHSINHKRCIIHVHSN